MCRHTARFTVAPPEFGTEIWCPRCWQMRMVVHVSHEDWYVVCEGCKRMRQHYGAGRLRAETVAAKHHNRFPTHKVHIVNAGRVMHTLVMVDVPLPIGDDAPPF